MSCDLEYIKLIGQGAYGAVYIARNEDGLVAAKYVFDTEEGIPSPQEIDIASRLDHTNLCHGISINNEKEYFKKNPPDGHNAPGNGAALVIVLPLADKYDLTQYLNTSGYLTLDAKIDIFFQIVSGIKFLHDNYILHLDLKSNNILIYEDPTNKVSGLKIKVTDFGSCCYTTPAKVRTFHKDITTLNVRPPEAFANGNNLSRYYSDKCDVWSLGITFYEILSHRTFYDDLTELGVKRYIDKNFVDRKKCKNTVNMFLREKYVPFSSGKRDMIIDLICDMLSYNPNDRPNVDQIINHPLFKDKTYPTGTRLTLILPTYNNINVNFYIGIETIITYSTRVDDVRTETVFLALNLFLRTYVFKQNNDPEYINYLAVASFWLAYKMIEPFNLHVVDITNISYQISNKLLDSDIIIEYENKVILTLMGLLYPWNFYNYCTNYTMCLNAFEHTINPYIYYNTKPEEWEKFNMVEDSNVNYRHFKNLYPNTSWYKYSTGDVKQSIFELHQNK